MYDRRAAGLPRPWTDDPLLASGHYTNIRRERDPGTIFAQRCISMLHPDDVVLFTIAYRAINRRQTVEEFGQVPCRANVDDWLAFVNGQRDAGRVVSTGRHLTPGRVLYERAVRHATTLVIPRDDARAAMKMITTAPGVGRFIGWQVLADLMQTGHVARDDDFVVVGDGAAFGIAVMSGARTFDDYYHDGSRGPRYREMRRVQGRIRPSITTNERYADWVRWLRDAQPSPAQPGSARLTQIDIEHALCEWTRHGVARTRRMNATS